MDNGNVKAIVSAHKNCFNTQAFISWYKEDTNNDLTILEANAMLEESGYFTPHTDSSKNLGWYFEKPQ